METFLRWKEWRVTEQGLAAKRSLGEQVVVVERTAVVGAKDLDAVGVYSLKLLLLQGAFEFAEVLDVDCADAGLGPWVHN